MFICLSYSSVKSLVDATVLSKYFVGMRSNINLDIPLNSASYRFHSVPPDTDAPNLEVIYLFP